MDRNIVRIDDNTWRIEDGFVRFFLLEGEEKALLIDSGVESPDARELAGGLTEKEIMLLNTHGDRDHVSGNGAFREYFIHPADYENCGMQNQFPESRMRPILGGEVIDLGGRELEVIAIPGHTFGSIAVLDRKNRVLYPGDSVQSGYIYMFGSHRDPEGFAASLEKLMGLSGFDRLYPSHGAPELPKEQIPRVLESWKRVRSGSVPAEKVSLFGKDVDSYTLDNCGFYL